MANAPEYAKRETILFRWTKQFHEKIAPRINSDAVETLRAAAWQLEIYLEEHGEYLDSEFLRAMQHSLEKIVQQRCKTKWSVARAKRDLRGRPRGVNQFNKKKPQKRRVSAPHELAQALDNRLIDTPRREFD